MIKRLDVSWDESARSDLQSIFDYIAEASQNFDIALKFVSRIEARCEKIRNAPNGGRPRDDILPACE